MEPLKIKNIYYKDKLIVTTKINTNLFPDEFKNQLETYNELIDFGLIKKPISKIF